MKNKITLFTSVLFFLFLSFTNYQAHSQCMPPILTGVTPIEAPVNAQLVISGSGFTVAPGVTSIDFNGVTTTNFTVLSDTEIEVTVPSGAVAGAITVMIDTCSESLSAFNVLEGDCSPEGDLFIAELYDHDSGSYGMIELYNPSSTTITFNSQYVLERAGDIGGPPAYSLILPGSIGPGDTYLVQSGVGVGCTFTEDAVMGQGINANDEFKLFKNGALIDIAQAPQHIGYTVRRNSGATAPNVAYDSNDWIFSSNNCSDLGQHSASPITGGGGASITVHPQDQSSCEGGQVSFQVSVDDPTGFVYQWKVLDASGNWVNLTDNSNYSGSTSSTLSVVNIPVGFDQNQYYCEVSSTSCYLISDAAHLEVVPFPDVADVRLTQPLCDDPNSTGTIIVDSPLGTGFSYSIDGTNFQTAVVFDNLTPGTYQITVKNANDCTSTTGDMIINHASSGPSAVDISITQPDCAISEGIIRVNSPLGTGLSYSIDGINFQTNPVFNGIAPGVYTLIVQNPNGCTAELNDIVLDPGTLPTLLTVQECREMNRGRNFILEVLPDESWSIESADFIWRDAEGIVVGNNESVFNVTEYMNNYLGKAYDSSSLTFSVTLSTGGCEVSADFVVENYFCFIPEGISPNHDGLNDSFNLEGLQVKRISIYNRWGTEVYSKNNYLNEWHGQSKNGSNLPTATYYYRIETMQREIHTGWVYLNR